MRASRRALRLQESATMAVTRRAAELRAEGREIIDFGAGEPDFSSPDVAVEAAKAALDAGFTRYTPAAGIATLRSAIAERYRRDHDAPWDAAACLVSVGAKAALFELLMVLVDDGDEVVLPTPAWVSFEEQVGFAGGEVVAVPTDPDERFAIRAQPLLDAVTERTRVVLVNSPSNPTGGVISEGELRSLVAECAERGIVVLSDETYEHFVYDGVRHASAAALATEFPDTVVVVSSFSKTYAMTGWRLGWALAAVPVIRKAAELQSHLTSNPTSFAMRGGLAALEGADADVERMIRAFAARRTFLVDRLASLPGVRCQPPDGAFYAFPDVSACYRDGLRGSLDFTAHLLEAGVAVVPGVAFGADDHIRISFACSDHDLEAGMARVEAALASL